MLTGKVKWFDKEKGYGFIEEEGGQDIFVHQTGIVMAGFRSLIEGDTVIYEVEESEGRNKAVNVVVE